MSLEQLVGEFGLEVDVAQYYMEVAWGSNSVQDFAESVYADNDDEGSSAYDKVWLPYAELKEIYKRVKSSDGVPFSSRRIRSGGTDFSPLVSSAEIMKLKLDETGVFHLDMGHIQNGHEVYSSFKGTCDVGQLLAIGRSGGFSYSDIMSGVDLSESAVKPEFKKFLVSAAKFQPVKDPVVDRRVATWVISGKELDGELTKWGLKNPGGIFSGVKVLGVDLDGTENFKVPVKSGIGVDPQGGQDPGDSTFPGHSHGVPVGSDFEVGDFEEDDFGDSVEDDEYMDPVEPEDGDIVIDERRGIGEVGGRWFVHFKDWDQAERVIKEKMDRDRYYPNVWLAEERGGYTLTSLDGLVS
jgi:hypothetical protein